MNIPSCSNQRIHESDYELFRARLSGKLCIALVFAVQIIIRIIMIFVSSGERAQTNKLIAISFTFVLLIILIVAVEYFLFKKRGQRIIKYATLIDVILLLSFLGDWICTLVISFTRLHTTNPPSFKVTAVFGMTGFAWRSLLVTLIVQKWQLRIIPPVFALFVASGFTIYYSPANLWMILPRVVGQLFNIVVIIYCEDKLKWRMIWTNLYRKKWIQVNNFILNNIPENIMILDMKGEPKFISDHCQSFMKKCDVFQGGGDTSTNPNTNMKEFFERIQDLHQLHQYESNPSSPSLVTMNLERFGTSNAFLVGGESALSEIKVEVLMDLIGNFKTIISQKKLQERQFIVYNGKLRMENLIQKEKSIEVKISYIQHFKNKYIILILRDMTKRDLLITLEETNKYKDQLLASVSHELRAPLNGNINLVEGAISSPKVTEDIKENLLIPALRSSRILMHLINDMLDMSQIKEKKLRLVFQPGDLEETLRNTAQLVELQFQKKEIDFMVELDPELPKSFSTDHLRLSQIVLNLLTNALKYTREGMVKVKAVPMNDGNWVKISVEDSGIGISQENIPNLFATYTRIEFDGRQGMNPCGVGLGLNIASSLADLLAPKANPGISVSSVLNQGSVFSFLLENKKQEGHHILRLEDIVPSYSPNLEKLNNDSYEEVADEFGRGCQVLQGNSISRIQIYRSNTSMSITPLTTRTECLCPKILIVDDNPFNTMAFETILSSLDIKCDSVYSGSCAIKKILARQTKTCGRECKPYSVVFMDQEMPEMTGSETIREIKRLQNESLVPLTMKFIGCTAHKSREEVDRFMEAGLEMCIHKPISKVMINDILKEYL